jgi:signal transduction histidine kinase
MDDLLPPVSIVPARPARVAQPLPRRRLAVRLVWVAVAAVLAAEASFFVPSLVRRREDWLTNRMTEAQLAAASVAVAPDGEVTPAMRDELLRLAGAEAIYLEEPGRPTFALARPGGLPDVDLVDVRTEGWVHAMMSTLVDLFGGVSNDADPLIAIAGPARLRPQSTVTAIVHRSGLHDALVDHVRRFGTLSLVVAAAAGLLLYAALLLLLVRPLRRLTESIAAFRADPERSAPIDLATLPRFREDEVSAATRELAAMQRELRAALWRNARLAALGVAVAKVNHDLRGTLSPAMLTAERLQMHDDPKVKRAGDLLIRMVERAADLTRRSLDFARDAPVALTREHVKLRETVADGAEQACAACPTVAVANDVAPAITLLADTESMVRVFSNLLRNAGEAGARHVTVSAGPAEAGCLAITVADDGPGLPDQVRAELFHPFVAGGRRGSTGLGLAIVHDLMRAQGGEVALHETGPAGTAFRLTMPPSLVVAAA